MFKKPKRKFQSRRPTTPESADEANSRSIKVVEVAEPEGAALQPSSSSGAFLSMHDEDVDVEVFQVKKSKRSRKLAEQNRGVQPPSADEPSATGRSELIVAGDVAENMGYFPTKPVHDDRGDPEIKFHHDFEPSIASGSIPDANVIFEVRRRRQMARQSQDVILLPSTENGGTTSNSRLIREDDQDLSDEGEDMTNEIKFIDKTADVKRREQAMSSAELDERIAIMTGDVDEWEKQQFQKARLSIGKNQQNSTTGYLSTSETYRLSGESQADEPLVSVTLLTFDEMKARIIERLRDSDEVYRGHAGEDRKLENDIASSENKLERLGSEVPLSAAECDFYKETTDYVVSALECYSSKLGVIDDHERAVDEILRTNYERHSRTRQAFVRDMDEDIRERQSGQGTMSVSISNLTSRRTSSSIDPVVGESSTVAERKQRIEQFFEHRKSLRRSAKRKRGSSALLDLQDGFSSDEDGETSGAIDKLLADQRDLSRASFEADVIEEYSDCTRVIERFDEWCARFEELYTGAYIDECLARLLTPLVRLELIGWCPWIAGCKSLEEFRWFRSLACFGLVRPHAAADDGADSTVGEQLIPSLLSSVVFPRLTAMLPYWDGMSRSQSRLLADFLTSLCGNYSATIVEDKYFVGFFDALVQRAQRTVADEIYFPLYPRTLLESDLRASMFYYRQYWTAAKLFENLLRFHAVLSTTVLKQLAVVGILNRYLLLPLRTARDTVLSLERCVVVGERIPELLAEEWCMSFDDGSRQTLQEFASCCHAVSKIHADKIRGPRGGNASDESQRIRRLLVRMVNVVKRLKDYKTAQLIEKELL